VEKKEEKERGKKTTYFEQMNYYRHFSREKYVRDKNKIADGISL
jgi:hypothetical protein